MSKSNDDSGNIYSTRTSTESSKQQQQKETLNLASRRSSSNTREARPRRSQPRLEKRVSIDIIPMGIQEIEWAMTDARIQDEDREIQEARERVRRKKEARNQAAAPKQ